MAIKKTNNYRYIDGRRVYEPESVDLYRGRVVAMETVTETRNWSDTMDYSDFRTTTCTYALVWVGTRGVPTEYRQGRDLVWYSDGNIPEYAKERIRVLEPHEQFGWIDCTNLFADRNGFSLAGEVDGIDMQLLWCGPEMLEAYAAWKAYQVTRTKQEAAEAAAIAEEVRKAAEKRAATAAKRKATDDRKRDTAEKLLAAMPIKGTTVTVNGFTGKVFWVGVTKYRGKWQARYGVKDSSGNAQWFDHSQVGK